MTLPLLKSLVAPFLLACWFAARDGNEPKKIVPSRIEPSRHRYRAIIEPSHICFKPSHICYKPSRLSLSSRAVLLHNKFLFEPKNLLFSKSSRGGCKSHIFLYLFSDMIRERGSKILAYRAIFELE